LSPTIATAIGPNHPRHSVLTPAITIPAITIKEKMMSTPEYDLVIVGAGIAGAIVAYQLGLQGKQVLILEAGGEVPADRSGYMKTFFKANAKTPESPYPPTTQNGVPATPDNPLGLPDPSTENVPRYTVLQI